MMQASVWVLLGLGGLFSSSEVALAAPAETVSKDALVPVATQVAQAIQTGNFAQVYELGCPSSKARLTQDQFVSEAKRKQTELSSSGVNQTGFEYSGDVGSPDATEVVVVFTKSLEVEVDGKTTKSKTKTRARFRAEGGKWCYVLP